MEGLLVLNSIIPLEVAIWIAAAILFAIIEAATTGLTSIWFSGGAVAAFILALCGFSASVQIIAFTVVSVALLLITRPLAKKHVNNKAISTNVDALIGSEGIVTLSITPPKSGEVKADGKWWTAVSEANPIPKGSAVIIKKVNGVTLTVEEKEKV